MQKNVLKKLFISHKWDLILCVALLTVALLLFYFFNTFGKKDGGYVQVKRDDKVIATYPLDKDGVYELNSFYGSNTLVIKNGAAYISESTCPDHLCEDMGKISKKGEMIICLPNGLFISVISGEEAEYDAVVQ